MAKSLENFNSLLKIKIRISSLSFEIENLVIAINIKLRAI